MTALKKDMSTNYTSHILFTVLSGCLNGVVQLVNEDASDSLDDLTSDADCAQETRRRWRVNE